MEHRLVDVRGGRIHLVEEGEGPLVLLVHGFPECWYSWRHQLPVLAAAGFRAVAIDVRGYGGSSRPDDVGSYGMLAHVADNVGVVRALGERTATVVGHDWGSPIAATSALLRPDVFPAVGLLSVPYTPPGGPRPTSVLTAAGGDEEFYVAYFQQPGRAEAEMEADVRGWLAGFYRALSGDTGGGAGHGVFTVPPGGTMRDRFPAGTPPRWLGEGDLEVYAREFERTGFTGALNRYRNMDRDWADLAAWEGAVIRQPSLYVAGELDASTTWLAAAIADHPRTLPGLVGQHVLEGRGHWIQQEAPEEVGRLLVEWLAGL
jgi:pimeloyl-ACP methyl ester carboxylesterase